MPSDDGQAVLARPVAAVHSCPSAIEDSDKMQLIRLGARLPVSVMLAP